MTPDERLEALLNRAGQTISDLPKATKYEFAYCLGKEDIGLVFGSVRKFEFCGDEEKLDLELVDYILHLTDVIDRLETALENVCGERDYLVLARKKVYPCDACIHRDKYRFEEPCVLCERANSKFEFAGVPEDWWVDNDD